MSKKRGASIIILIAVVIFVLISSSYLMRLMTPETRQYSYSEILYMFEDQQVSGYELDLGSNEVVLKMADGSPDVVYRVAAPSYFLDSIEPYVQEYNEDHPDDRMEFNWIQATDNTWLWSLVPYLLMIAAMGVLWYFMFKQTSGGGKMNQFGKANLVKTDGKNGKKTTFADVAGADEEKEELREIVDFLKHPKKFNDLGARIPKGVLLLGPPGTGKTLLAKAVAGEADVPFFSISGSEFVEMFVGMGANKVRDLFRQANEKAPCIVFIDEIDTIGKKRDGSGMGGNDEREQTLNQLLTEMDGFEASKGVVILAATNRPETLDPALLRPGRFDRRVPVELPDLRGREDILRVHAKKVKLGDDVDLNAIARAASGASGAELANMINEAALRAVRQGRQYVNQSDLQESIEVVIAGYQKKNKILSDQERKIVSYHEIGHALVTALQSHSAPVAKITIIPRTSGALGYTMQVEQEERNLMSKEEILDQIATLSGAVYDYCGAICLVDALYFPKYLKLLLALRRQVEYSRAVILNKADLVTEEQLTQVEQSIRAINPSAALYRTTYANVSLREILSGGPQEEAAPQESSNTESSRPVTITLSTQEAVTPQALRQFLEEIAPSTYRVKGFCRTTEGTKNISMVGTVCQIEDWGEALGQTQLVIISSVGIRIFSITLEAAGRCFQSPVDLR